MRQVLTGCAWALVALGTFSGCSGEDLSGYTFNLTLTGRANECTAAPADYSEKLEYRVQIDGQDVEVAVGPDGFATGVSNGCSIQYETVVWGEQIDDFEIRWKLSGSATINPGGGCNTQNGTDWDGVEVFEVVSSENPDISPGCEYEVALAGKYTGEQ